MKVFFSCSTGDMLQHRENYLAIVNTIKQHGHVLTRDWLPIAIKQIERNIRGEKRSKLYTKVMSAISRSDVVILDCTVRSMGIGHQLTYSLDKNKPTLLLYNRCGNKMEDLFISGSKSTYLTIKGYNNVDEIEGIVNAFLLKNLSRPKVRFQLVLDKKQNDFIEWASYRYRRNKSEVIKSAIDKLMSEDIDYCNNGEH